MKPMSLHEIIAVLIVATTAACGKDSDTREFLSEGNVAVDSSEFRAVDYSITSDNYKRWLAAQAALDSVDIDAELRLDPRRATADDVDRVVRDLRQHPTAREAIERSGLSVRDYVLTSIALAQSWDAVNTPDQRFPGVPAENVTWLRAQAVSDPVVQTRPRVRILEDDDDSDSDSDSDGRGKGRGKHNGKNRGKGRG